LKNSKYSAELGAAVEDNVNPETIIYLLKNQLLDAAIFNHNLKRVISFLIWKLSVERANANLKAEMGEALQKTVNSLEDLLKKYAERRQTWKQQLDKYDYDIMCLKNQLDSRRFADFTFLGSSNKPRLRKAINKRLFMRQSNNKLDGTCRATINRLFSPMGKCDPQRQLSGTDFTRAFEAIGAAKSKFNAVIVGTETGKNEQHTEMGVKEEQITKLDGELHEAQIELAWHKALDDLLIEELKKTRGKLDILRNQMNEIKSSAERAIKDENENWKCITDSLKVFILL